MFGFFQIFFSGVVFFWKGEEIELVKVCIKCKHRTDNRVAQDLTI